MTEELLVHLKREELHSVDVSASIQAHGSFEVVFINHAGSVHAHLQLDGDITEVARIQNNNPHIANNSRRSVRIHVDKSRLSDRPITGKLKVGTGYGAKANWVNIELRSQPKKATEVDVEQSLRQASTGRIQTLVETPELLVVILGGVAILLALSATLAFEPNVILLSSLALLLGVAVALIILLVV